MGRVDGAWMLRERRLDRWRRCGVGSWGGVGCQRGHVPVAVGASWGGERRWSAAEGVGVGGRGWVSSTEESWGGGAHVLKGRWVLEYGSTGGSLCGWGEVSAVVRVSG